MHGAGPDRCHAHAQAPGRLRPARRHEGRRIFLPQANERNFGAMLAQGIDQQTEAITDGFTACPFKP
jgi:hypothetical protein